MKKMTNWTSSIFALALTVAAPAAWADYDLDSEAYNTVESVQTVEIADDGSVPNVGQSIMDGGPLDRINEADLILDRIINMGKKVWKIIDDNRPVVNHRFDVAHALPTGVMAAGQLDSWSVPTSKVYRTTYKNGFGAVVVNFKFRVLYTYGGGYQGKGAYLTNVMVMPGQLDVAWGYKFNAEGLIPSVVNVGTAAAPVAGMSVDVKWKVVTTLKHHEKTMSFFVKGNGELLNLTDGN